MNAVEAHKLAVRGEGFKSLLALVKRQIYEHAQFLKQRGAPITLHGGGWVVAHADTIRVATFTPNPVLHQIKAKGVGTSYKFTVVLDPYGSPVVTASKRGTPMGVVDEYSVIEAVRSVMDSITDLTPPI